MVDYLSYPSSSLATYDPMDFLNKDTLKPSLSLLTFLSEVDTSH